MKLFNAHTHQLKNNETAVFQFDIAAELPIDSFFSVGIHPEKALSWNNDLKTQLQELASDKQCLAIGEIGLDSRFDLTNQQEIYAEQLKIAATLKKPVILHCVNTWYKCMSLHKQIAPDTLLIYHGFSKPTIIRDVLAYEQSIISIGAHILNNELLKKVVVAIPINRLLIETDDSACDLISIYHEIAQLKSIPLPDFVTAIAQNAKHIFEL